MKMSIQEQIAPYMNRFVLLFNQNATAKLEIGCNDWKVSVNISHDLGPVTKKAPVQKSEQKQYSDVLKKTVRPSQLNRLKKKRFKKLKMIYKRLKKSNMKQKMPSRSLR
jgi:hypothetical protein